MKRFEANAFDAADNYCKCEEGEHCEASAFSHGYILGYRETKDMLLSYINLYVEKNVMTKEEFNKMLSYLENLNEDEIA